MTYTAGPWEARTFLVKGGVRLGDTICHVGTSTSLGPSRSNESVANAQLIAAAPELLEALKPFASIAERILAESPNETTEFCLFVDCEGCKHLISLDGLRTAISTVAKAEILK